jgi:hypothetical protein
MSLPATLQLVQSVGALYGFIASKMIYFIIQLFDGLIKISNYVLSQLVRHYIIYAGEQNSDRSIYPY